jgi:hypothetical protein
LFFKSLLIRNKTNDGIVFPVDQKKIVRKDFQLEQNTKCGIIFSMVHRKMCYDIETKPSHFPTHAYVASVKHVAGGTRFSAKIPPNNPPLVICQSQNRTTRARASARIAEACPSILNTILSFGLHFCYFKRLSVRNKINDGIVGHEKNCFNSLPIHNKTNDSIVFHVDHKKIV